FILFRPFVRKHVNDLYEDLRDGHNLISLLEVLSGDTLPREKGRMRFHRLQNVQIALDYLKRRQVKLVNIRNDDITDGNPKLTLGLIWTIILHFQISDIHVTGESEDMTAKERLLLWSQQMTEGYVGVRCDNFTTSWRDGRLFNAIIHKYRPDLVDMSRVSTQSSRSNLEQAFCVAEQLGVARLLDPEDVDVSSPDEKSVITYVSTLYDVFPKVPEGMEGISANDVDIKWVEYQNMLKYLSQWIKHNVTVMSDRNFPSNPVELKALYTQYLQFKENEIPPKENEKAKIKHLYKMLEVWIEFGRIQLPQGYHPNDVEKEWGKLIVAMLEREKSLRPEVDRLEMLQQIANRVQRDCVAGEDKLVLARTALQSDAKRLESGIQFQNEAEIAGYLLECENLLRQQVLDIQLLLDGKFYLADQLVQRVSKLRDDLLALRTECSTVYSKGRTLTSEQTKMMISGITQSLNSNFSPNFSAGLSPALTHGGLVTSGGSPAMSPAMTPSMQPASVQTYLSGRGGGGMEPGVLQQLKHMQIRKPMLKSSFLDPNLTEDEVNVKFVHDLLNWVEEMQVQLDQAEWGSDLPSVESNLGIHKDFHKAIKEFQMSIKEAKMSEIQMTQPLKQSYSEKLNKLESQYGRLLKCSSERQKHLDSLYDFVSRATRELIWLNEKEEEEVAFDWSERNSNISRKRDYHADLMRELDDKEEVIKSVQEKAESLLLENHPARLTIEAYRAAMQTQWSWILQLCHCVEQHLKENAVYFDFFSDAKESLDYLRSLQDAIHRKYSCDRNSSLHRLEDLIQESMDEKEQLLKYSSTVGGLVGRAKSVVQLKARNPENPIRTSLPVKSICDYRQIEITISKEDECVLVSNSHRAKWKVISTSGNEAMVPSVCFSVPPPNKEATEMASRIEQLYQNALVVSWHYLMTDIRVIRKSTVASIKTLLPGDHEQVLSSLQSHFEDFLRDSDESEVFTVADCAQLEKEVLACKEYYEELLKSAEREEHEESVYNLFISEVRNFRMRVEGHEEQLIRKIRTPLDRDDLQECVLRITEQEKVELDRLKDDLETLREKCEVFLRQAAASPSVPTLSSELNILTQSTNQVYSMCCIYLEKLKTVSLVVKHSQSAEALVKLYEAKLCEEDTINANIKSIDGVMSTLKQWRSEIDERREVFHDLEDELQNARVVSERMFKTHNERDFDLDWHKEKADQLKERWQNIHSQIENRLRDLEGISKSLKYYKDTYNSLDEWSKEMETKQLKAQENQPEDRKALAEFLNQQKVLVTEIEQKQSKIEECQKYSEQYAVGVKEYELQLMTYRAMVQHKSPVKRRKMQSSSDVIQQEFMDLRTRYTALVTLMTQYVKFAGETLKRAEEDERSVDDEKKEHGDKVNKLLNWMSSMKTNLNKDAKAQSDGKPSTESTSKPQVNKSNYLIVFFIVLFNRSSALDLTEKQEAKEQLKSLHQAYSELSQQCSDAASSADQNTGLGLLEAQLITTGLIWPEQHLYMDLEDAFKNKLVDDAMCKQLQELNEAKKCLQHLQFALESLPVITALENGAISEQTAIKIIEIQLATGGLRPTYTGDILHLERAFQLGLIPESLFIQILERKDNGNISLITQLFAGGIVDPKTGRKLTVEEALSESLIDQDTASEILSHQAQNGGIVNPCNRSRLTVDEAVQCDLISSSSALLVLERQKAFMGLLWPNAGEILSFSTSLQQNMITDKLTSELLRNRHKITALYIPETSEVVDIDSAVENNLIETFTKELLKTIEIPDVFPDIDELNNRFSSWLVMRELQIDGSCSAGEEISDENSTDAPSPSEAKQLFISYLMMNSYMDPKSGQRLLIFDWQLNKMAKLLFETSESEHVDETSGLHMKVSEESQLNNNISDNDNTCLIADYSALGELQICEPLENTTEKEHGVVNSTALHNCLKPTLPSESVINTIETDHKWDIFLDSVEHMTVIETNKLSKDSTCSNTDKCQAETSDVASPQPSEAMQLPQTTFSITATASSLCSMEVNPECHDASKGKEKHSKDSTLLSSETISYTEMPSEFPHTEVVWDDKLERDYAIHLLKAQVEEGGILDVTSGKRYDLEAALGKGLIDEETVLEVLALQLQEDGLKETENATLSVLNISVNKGCISSKVALQIMEKQNLLGGFYDAAAGKTIHICDALETGLITDDLSRSVLSSEAIRKAIIDPEGKCVLSVNDAHQSGMLDDEEAERMLHSQQDEREDVMVPDLAKRGQMSLRSDEATQVSTDIACVSSSQGSLLPTITDTPSKGISTKDSMFDTVSETNGIGEDCDEQCASFKTTDSKNDIETTDERERGFTLEGNETKRPHNSVDTFVVDDSCKTVSPSPCVRQVAYLETTASQVVSPVQSDSGISCSSQSDICSEERKSESVPNPEQEFNRSKVESESNAYFDKRPSEGLSTSLPMVENVAQVRTLAEPQSNSSLCCTSATIAEVNVSTDDQHTLAQNMLNEKEEVSSQTNASYKAKYSNNVSENLDDEHSVEDSGVFSSENRVKDMVKYEDRNAPQTEVEPSVVCAESSIDCKVEKNDDIENSVGFKGSEDTCQLNLMDLVGSTVNSEQLPLEIVTNSSQGDSSGGNHNIQHPSEQGIFCKTTTKDELAGSSESDFTSDNESSLGHCSQDIIAEFSDLQSARQITSPSVKIMLDQNSEQSGDIFNQCQAGDTVVAEGVHQDDLHLPHMAMAEDESLPKSMGGSDLKSFLNELIQMKMDGASVDETQKQKCQAIDSIIDIIQHHSGISPTNHPNSNERGGDPDILLDLKKHEEPREAQNWPSDESNDEPKHQTDLLEMIQGISTDRDKGMLEEVDGKPSSPLGGTDLREESMEMHVLDEGVSIMVYFLQRYSTQNYLECVGRLQDHCDTLEDIRSDLQTKGPLAEDIEGLHCQLEEVQDIEKDLSGTRQLLEDAAFDIQNFISEHAQFLSPTDSRHLLRALSTTQRSFKELMDRVFTQRQTLEIQLEICEDETQQQKQREFSEKLQELFDDLTQTENRLIGHQQQAASAKTVGDLQQYQQEHQALQKDLQANASALNEVISSTKKFLEENRSKLTPEQISALENKLEELKSKANMLNQKAEESRKDLEQVLTSAIKQETEKEAAVEQLEESKTKIEGLLGWISNIGKEKEMGGIQKDQMVKQNGNMPEYTSMKGIIGEEDDPNGNALDTTDNTRLHAGEKQDGKDLDLDQQFNRVQAHHQEILSQQQDLIIATQSAQALLDKQAQVLSPAEKDKLQRDIKELKGRYEASLTQAEQQMKQVQTVQEELQKFKGDCEEFETWLQQATGEMEELGAPAAGLDTLSNNLQRQKSFSEDVISHKGDLRFITISGQKVLDAAKARDHSESDGLPMVDMSGTCAAVKERLDSAASRYKALHTQCNQLGNNLKDVVDKYKKYEDASGALLKWLNVSEEESRRQQSEPIAGDPQTLQRQLEETKSLQGQTTTRQAAVDTLRKTADALISAEGDLLSHPEEIQETVDDIIERYDNLSKSVSDRNEKLQVTLTRSLSVQDGLDEMMSWMEKVEESVKETPKVPLDSSSIADALSKEAALEQDMSSRQSSILAMKAKVKKFVESAEPAAAALLQTKMEGLSQRFTDASEQHKQQVAQMEELRDKVEQFEKTSEKVQQFVLKSSQALSETDGPGKTVTELSQLLQLTEHSKDVETLQKLTEELCKLGPEGSAALLQSKMQNISDSFNAFKETNTEKKEEVSSCQKQLQEFKSAAGVLMKWLEETKEQVPVLQPNCSEQGLGTDLQKVNCLLDEWTSKAPAVQDINSKGSALCSLISVLTSPAKAKMRHNSAVSNGSDPGSHSYLTNQELMLVQQNMSYINNDYEHLGELLKARSSELSALLKRVQGVHDQAESLRQWMEDTKKTAASLSGCQVQVQLQQLRENLLRLIEEHPDSPEAEKWKHMMAQIDAGWEEVKGTMAIRKQHLEESSRMLELFQTTQPQLSQWLQEKELMMGVLGPLSVDPNMLNTQKQQVQILLKEFDSRTPQYEKLSEAATAIASASEQQDPAVEQVKEQLASISQKWQALTGQLSQRHALIEQAVGKTTQFQELLQSLSKSATCLETELNNQQALSTHPDEVKKQIEVTNAILAQLREEKKRLKEAESVCSELSAMVTEEYLRADLTKQLESITKPFRQLEDKAGKRIEQLNSAFASSQQFHQTSKDFQAWLNQTLQEQCKPQPVSANAEKLKQSLENSAVQKAISEHEEPYNTIIKEGEALLQSTEGAEKVALHGQLSALKSSWDDVKKSNAAQAEKLQGALQRALKYKEHSEKLSSWLQECEDREKNVKLSANSVEIEGSLSQLKAIQKDVDKHRGQVAMANTAADSLLEVVTSDGDSVREEKATTGKRVDKLTEDLTLKREALENISQKLKEFNDLQKEAKGQLEAARKQLDSHSALGVQAYSNKNLTNMKAQHNSLEGVHNQIEHLKNLAKSLVVDASEVEGVTDLLLQADSLEKDHMSITKKVEDACSTLENKLQGIGQFQNSIREMFANFTDLDDEFDGMAPVGRGLDTLRDQQSTIKDFVARLQDLMTNTANGRDSCKKMLESEASPDLLGLKRDLETLGKQCGKLMDRATGRREQVEETLSHLEEFYVKAQEFTHKLSRAEKQEESQGSVGLETEVINQQLETFKVFQRDVIESLQSQLQELNTLGQALIQNAAKGTSTKKLDQDLEEVNTRWNTLNKKVAERSAQLHETLLHCGRFQDALECLLSWLTDTEELVANQKPPSAEFKVVKAQIQEQKLLQRLLDDRRATVELIKTEGRKVTDLADTVDKEKIAREIECLGKRWDDLLKKAENRQKQLENILVVAQQFHETLVPLTEWLTATEKRLANSEPIGTQTSKLEEQISQHKALEEEVLGRGKILYQAMSLGQSLRTVSCVDDKELVQAKLDNTHSSYIELQEHCRQKAELLRQALANAQLFGEDEVALMTWLEEVHSKLSEVSIQDYTTAVLAKQHAEQLALHEDIELRKQNIEQAILNGLELLKQTTGDEVVVIQGKLDGIKTRYSEINTMSNNVSKTLDKALSLATKLQNTHEELNAWLEKVESELAMFKAQEPVGEQLTCLQERQKTLMKEVKDQKPLVDSLNEVSSALLELVPWRAREGLDRMVTDDNERYRTSSDAITQHVDQTGAAILKSQQFEQAATSELEWLTEAERKLSCLGDVRLEPEQTTAQLQAQKSFSMDIMRHKDAVDVIVKTGKAIINNKDEAEKQALRVKLQALSEKYSVVSQLNSERCLQLERAHSLASQFWETYDELWPWLQETRTTFTQLSQPAIEYEALRQQQEELRQMRELIAEHKPHIDKMNKTGPQLLELSPTEGAPIREKYEAADKLYSQLKVDVKHRAAALDEAFSKSTQFHDKIDPMLESLERIAERLRQPPSISVEIEKIREQISENKAVNVDLEKLQPSYETLKQRGEEMIARSEGADKDLSAKAVQDKLDQMVFLWNDIQALLEEREAKLLDVMDLAEKFWCDHCALNVTIKDTHDMLKELEEPGVDPSVVKQQQESAEGFREEINGLQEELNVVQNLGVELMTACGEPDKPVIKKSIDEVNSAWETLNKTWKERVETLEEAMQAAVQFQDSLQNMFDSVDIMEGKLDSMSPVGTDLETVKQQIEELKEFKGDAYQLQIEMERLNHQTGLLLKKVVEEADRTSILEPMNELKMLWDDLDKKIINRQHKLEGALLALGQFQHALDELVAWLTHTEELLGDQRKACGDPKAIEIELAKHHVLQNDVLAHKTTVEAVNKAGSDLIDSSAGEEARGLQNKLENLNQRWRTILEKTEQRRQLLDSALLQAQGFHGEIEDMQQWLKESERQLLASKALGGLPDTAREQLNTHLELCSTLEAKEEIYKQLLDRGQQILAMTPEGQDSTTELDLRNLQEKWACVRAKVTERKVKLEEALAMATDFHNSLQDFINWLTQAEQTLAMASPASRILETIMFQIDEHKVFVTEVNSHRDQIIELDKTGTHLKYFSQKQDVVLIRNLLLSVQGRWEKVVQRSVERGRLLDDARKRAKQFHESWNKLMEWLEESERALDSELEIANDPDKIKTQLTQHKEFQKALGSKHSVYDTTSRTGRALKDKTSLLDDNQKLDDMLSELRDKWDTVCGKSVERQNKLEEALLFSGQFTDALQALIDWLYKVEPQLAEDQPVHGDIDLVLNLIDSHKVFQKELGKRTGSVQALKRSARELIESSHDDSSWVKVQMQELSTRWETVCSLSVSKQTRLEQALCQAEEFHSTDHILLEWLAEAEQSLRFHGALPDDEEALRALIEQHKEFMKKLEEKRQALNKATSLGEAILSICHPDSITTIKHWNTIIKARFEEVRPFLPNILMRSTSYLAWARQETTLGEKDKEPLPQELEEVKTLIAEHQAFMEEMTRKQPDVDKITKTHKRKATADPPVQSQIPVLEKGRTARKRSPTQSMFTTASQAQIETKNPRVNLLVSKWQQVWLLALDRRRKLNDAMDRLEELKEFANFDFDVWRKRYMRWMNHKKSRVMDFFRRIDKDQDGKVTRQEFIDGILSSKFPTSRLEMSAVADIFDRDGDGYIDYYEFVAALHPNKDAYKPLTDADKIEDEVTRQVAKCKCPKRFQVEQIGANKYRFYLGNQFGDSQQLRLVRILRSTVMVRVGGGWMALDEFLVKNDPCRAKGRTNVELREKFILPEGTTQVMASFRYRGRRSRPSSRGTSPNRSNSSHSCPAQPNPPGSNTPKTPQHVTRNYDKPWLTNSKSATPLKSSDSFDSQGSSNESTPIQGSKLRLPGYLSGKGFQSGEDGSLINAAVMKVRGQAMGLSKIPSRPGSKAGSRGSSRRGSDASDFDISDIQSVYSDVLETVTVTPRSASRQHGGKPSKIPTPQRRSTPTSKLAKTTKR
uniref:Dystonin n=1 Tax=Sinocyclocheilus anshuiensis TaxID=1608454 RepID=A0A671PU66_9TELE